VSKVVVFNHLTLNGGMQAPGRADEDRPGGFAHGGWARPRGDAIMGSVAGDSMGNVGALLLGRRTCDAAIARSENPTAQAFLVDGQDVAFLARFAYALFAMTSDFATAMDAGGAETSVADQSWRGIPNWLAAVVQSFETSAAWLRGYAQRSPYRQIIVADAATPIMYALKATYCVLRTNPAPAHDQVDGLPVPTVPELFVEVAQLAPRLELDTARGWLHRLLLDTTPEEVIRVLRGRRVAHTRARAGFLAETCGTPEHGDAIAALGSVGPGPFFTGPRSTKEPRSNNPVTVSAATRRDGGKNCKSYSCAGPNAPFAARWRVYDSGHVGGSC
jgi:hypothetical protein